MVANVNEPTFYFYDLETSGFNPREARIMQFGGQRTDMNLKPVGEPHNYYIKLSPDILPDPGAVLVTGITPQLTQAKGVSEAEFLKLFFGEIVQPDTIFLGFNNIRFDDEFMRFLMYRNFYDAYAWHWKNGNSRWDLLDASRMTRALRPEGIKWPLNTEGIQTNQLGLLASVNKLEHSKAHDALSDVLVTINLARLIKSKQPKLFEFLLKMRKKDEVAKLVNSDESLIYTSGKYPSRYEKTTIVSVMAKHPERAGVLVYDLRHDPRQFADMRPEDLASIWRRPIDEEEIVLPVKPLQFNRCPAIAPLNVLDKTAIKRLQLDMNQIEKNLTQLKSMKDWPKQLLAALDIINNTQQTRLVEEAPVDNKLYDGFLSDYDQVISQQIRQAKPAELLNLGERCRDERLKSLLPLYKARNFSETLSDEEKNTWTQYCQDRLLQSNRLDNYFTQIQELKAQKGLTKTGQNILRELEDYGKSLKVKLA